MSTNFQNTHAAMRVDVNILRDGLNVIRGIAEAHIGSPTSSKEDYLAALIQIAELAKRSLWKEEEVADAAIEPSYEVIKGGLRCLDTILLRINGSEIHSSYTKFTYEELVSLAEMTGTPSVTYRGGGHSGIVAPGETIDLVDGSIVNVCHTGNA